MRKLPIPWASPGEAIFYATLILVVFGTFTIFSASFVFSGQQLGDGYFFLKKHLTALLVGLIVATTFARIDYHRWPRYVPIFILVTLALLAAVPFLGIDANGARRWLKLGITFQPSELAKLTAVLMAAAYLGPRIDRGQRVSIFSWPVLITAILGAFVLKQPDMGTAVVIMGLCLALYLPSGIPAKQIYGLLFCGAGAIVYLVYAAAYRAERILAWLDPWAYQQTSGYQTVQSLLAIGSGGLFGTGLGMGPSKFHYLPEAHTDFAFAVLCQEMGFLRAVVVLILFALFAWYGIKIALRAADGLGMILAAGATLLVIGQALGNIAMVTGIVPVTGIPLPFISFGGTSLVINLAAVGLLLGVGRRQNESAPATKPPERTEKPSRFRLVRGEQRPARR